MRIGFLQREFGFRLFRISTENDKIGMLEANNHNEGYQVIPIFAENVETCCENSFFVPATEVGTAHVDLVNRNYKRLLSLI